MKYVILKDSIESRCFPFLFSNDVAHDEMAHFAMMLLYQNTRTGEVRSLSVFSAGTFTPETGAIRGAKALDILAGEAGDDLSKYDDFLINTNDQTHGRV